MGDVDAARPAQRTVGDFDHHRHYGGVAGQRQLRERVGAFEFQRAVRQLQPGEGAGHFDVVAALALRHVVVAVEADRDVGRYRLIRARQLVGSLHRRNRIGACERRQLLVGGAHSGQTLIGVTDATILLAGVPPVMEQAMLATCAYFGCVTPGIGFV